MAEDYIRDPAERGTSRLVKWGFVLGFLIVLGLFAALLLASPV
jgi:hypothetical protein